MSTHLQADTSVVNALLARFPFTSYNSIVQARVLLAQQIRLSMQYPQAYQIPIGQQLPAEQGVEATAQYVHPWNVACALLNVCLNGTRFGGENLAPQEDLMVYVGQWERLAGCTAPTAIVPLQEAPITPPAPSLPPVAPPAQDLGTMADADDADKSVAAQLRREADAEAPPVLPSAQAQQTLPGVEPAAADPVVEREAAVGADLPDSNISLERTGQSGRPQKSPFEKKIEPRNKVAPPPFWWVSLTRSAPLIFHKSPAGALDDSSTGAGPVQSYMVLVALLRQVLAGVDPHTNVASLRTFLAEIDAQVSKLESAPAANQLRDILVPKK